MRKFLLLIGVIVLFPAVYYLWRDLYNNFLERNAPYVRVMSSFSGVGQHDASLELEVGDSGAGLQQLVVRCEQGPIFQELFRKAYPSGVHKDFVSVALNLEKLNLKEGKARLIITLTDATFWRNSRREELDLSIDFQAPELQVLTSQNALTRGGVGLVLLRAKDALELRAGVRVGEEEFEGFPAKKFDPSFADYPDVYFVFFTVPLDENAPSQVLAFARDWVGNETTSAVPVQIRKLVVPTTKVELGDNFFETKIPELYNQYLLLKRPGSEKLSRTTPGLGRALFEDRKEQFRVVNEDFRRDSEARLRKVLSVHKGDRGWSGPFLALQSVTNSTSFAQRRIYSAGGKEVGNSLALGFDITSTPHADVMAVNTGAIVFEGDLGVLGKTMVVDHGFGLTSIYSNLSSFVLKEGVNVNKGDVIAKSGNTGLADADRLHFEMRLFGDPVSPLEWWDEKWISDHVTGVFTQVRSVLDTEKAIQEAVPSASSSQADSTSSSTLPSSVP